MSQDTILRDQLLALLRGGNAYMTFDQAVADFPAEHFNTQLPHVPYTFWHLLEHMRIAQWDILAFIRSPAHESPPWPEGYWPAQDAQAGEDAWKTTLNDFHADREALEAMVRNPKVDLYSPLPQGPKYTILREVLLVADHNAYHTGEFAAMRGAVGAWPKDRTP